MKTEPCSVPLTSILTYREATVPAISGLCHYLQQIIVRGAAVC